MPVASITSETRTRIENVRWDTYVALADDRRGNIPRMTFDNGVLELMSPRRQHENIGRLLGRIVETFTEVSGIEIQSVASTTFRRPDLQRAFEADESYYIQHAEQIRPKEEVDLTVDPPPDLVIEVELTSSAISKLQLFAAMGIPEVWRHNGESLTMFRLADDNYVRISESEQITGLTTAMADSLLSKRFEMGENALIRTFRASIETV